MQTNGIVFNIQKFSIHDGPGIRTTVFLKGCPLRCKWCANPESQLSQVQILYDKEKCAHCGTCTHVCPNQAISMGDDSYVGMRLRQLDISRKRFLENWLRCLTCFCLT